MAGQPPGPLEISVTMLKMGVRIAAWAEEQAVALLRSRLFPDGVAPAAPVAIEPPTLEVRMRRLLDRALEQSSAESRMALFDKLVDMLVPDEARILGALSDGSASPLVNIRARTRSGASELLLENASLIGRTANLTLVARTPAYVSHLVALGLVELGPEDPALKNEYEILLADPAALKSLAAASRGMVPARVERRTLLLSSLGRELWSATCRGNDAP
jgi:hypothetical protein